MQIGSFLIGGSHTFVIAEAGVNHNGSRDMAMKLIDAAAGAGADAVKFQTWKTEALVTRQAQLAAYQERAVGGKSQFDMLRELELSYDDFAVLKAYAETRGILFLSTPDEEESLDFLVRLGVPALKVGSGEIGNYPYLKRIARQGLPVILSTGMATLGDVERALSHFPDKETLAVLHCTSEYPASFDSINLRAMNTIRNAFGVKVGLSDHSEGGIVSALAVALGACVIEKHLTLDRTLPGPDHMASLDPAAFYRMVQEIRIAEVVLGSGQKAPTAAELANKKVVAKSLVARRRIAAGQVITEDDLCIKRPGGGLAVDMLPVVMGKKSLVAIEADEEIHWGQIAL